MRRTIVHYVNLNPFRRYMGFRAADVNNAIKQSYLFGTAGAGANSAGFIAIDRSTFRVLEDNEAFLASIIAHEMYLFLISVILRLLWKLSKSDLKIKVNRRKNYKIFSLINFN